MNGSPCFGTWKLGRTAVRCRTKYGAFTGVLKRGIWSALNDNFVQFRHVGFHGEVDRTHAGSERFLGRPKRSGPDRSAIGASKATHRRVEFATSGLQ